MGDKISQLPAATSVDGTEIVPLVQGGVTKKVTGLILRNPAGPASGDLTGNYPNPTLAAITTAQTVGSATQVPVVTVDTKGRVTGLTTAANPQGTVTSVVGGTGLTGGTITSAGTLAVSYGTTAGTAAQGNDARLSDSRIPTGAASGDLAGTYPSPTLAEVTTAQSNIGSGTQVPVISVDAKGRVTALSSVPVSAPTDAITALTGDVTAAGPGSATSALATITTAQTNVGSSTTIPIISVDAKGRVTALGSTPVGSSAGGTVTSITAGTGLSGGTITDSGTLAVNYGTTAGTAAEGNDSRLSDSRTPTGTAGGDLTGTYPNPTLATVTTAQTEVGNSTTIPVITVNAKGQITALTTAAAAGGVSLATTAPANLASVAAVGTGTTAARDDHQHAFPTASQVGALGATAAAGGDLTGNYPNPTLAAITTAQTVGSATQVPVVTVDAKGRVTGMTTAANPQGTVTSVTGGTGLTGGTITGSGTLAVSYGTTAGTAAQGNDSRLSDSRTPTGAAGGDLTGTYPNPTLNTVSVAKGGTGQTSYTNGQLLIGNSTGNTLAKATLTAGSNITITNGPGTITIAATSTIAYAVDYLIVAGGGSGASAGGGGAGGVLSGALTVTKDLTYPVTIGAGGASVTGNFVIGNSGSNTSALTLTSIGGGGGGAWSDTINNQNGLAGGSGGGAGLNAVGATNAGGAGTNGQGFAGGNANQLSSTGLAAAGGGGGAAAGGNKSNTVAGAGGAGVLNAINGTSLYWAGGGGSGTQGSGTTPGAGGIGGGGGGGIATGGGTAGGVGGGTALNPGGNGNTSGVGGAGGANTGGGGGAMGISIGTGGNGGSGVFILRYLGAQRGTGGTVTSSGGYTIHTFLTSGSYVA